MQTNQINIKVFTLPELVQGLSEIASYDPGKLEETAHDIIKFVGTVAAHIMVKNMNVSDLMNQRSFSEIYSQYGINIFLLSGHRKQLAQKFIEEFGQVEPQILLEQFGYASLKRLNDAAILSDMLFQNIRTVYRSQVRQTLESIPFSQLYFTELPKLKWEELALEEMLAGSGEMEPHFTIEELQKKLREECPNEKALLEKFTEEQINLLRKEGVLI